METQKPFHLNYRIPLVALIFVLIGAGFYSFFHIKTSLYPEVDFPKIKIIINAGQVPVNKMMATITVPIENMIKKTEGVDYIRSKTSRGSCEMSVFLQWNRNVDKAKQQIESSVNQFLTNTSGAINVSVEKMSPSILPVIGYAIDGNLSQVELKNIAEFQVKPFLSEVDGVANVVVTGGKTKEYQIVVKPEKLSELNISLAQIQSSIEQENIFQSNGYISDHNRMYLTLTDNELENTEELKNLVIHNGSNRLILLKDIADMQVNEAKEYVKVHANGKELPLIAIMKQPYANVIEVSDAVEQQVKQLQLLMPKGVRLIPFYKQASFEKSSIKSIQYVLWLGLAASFLVILLFLRSLSATAAVYFSIPFSMTLTLTVLYGLGYSFNIMTLGAIAASIGLMIDDAIIVIEQMLKHKEEYPEAKMSVIIGKSIRYLFPAMIGSSLSTIVIFIPFVLLSGAAGAYFKVLAFTMIIALSSSFLVSWWITPMLFLFFSFRKKAPKPFIYLGTGWIRFILNRPIIGFVIASIFLVCLFSIPSKLSRGVLPEMDEGNLVMNFKSPSGTTLEETDRMLQTVDKLLKEMPDVESYSRRIGTQMGFFITEPNRGDVLIQLKKNRTQSTEVVEDSLRSKIKMHLPKLSVDFGHVISNTISDLISHPQPIEIKLFGDDHEQIQILSSEIANIVARIPGVKDVSDGLVSTGPEVSIRPNVPLLAQLGLNPSDFQYQMQTQIEGNIVSSIIHKDQQLNVRILYPNANQTKIHTLRNTNILLPGGSLKPLSSVARIELGAGESEINRENQKEMGVISAGLSHRDLSEVTHEIKQQIDRSIHLPSGFHIEYAGLVVQQDQSFKELLLIFITGLISVFMVILFLFKKIRVALLILFLAGLGVAGSLLALFITKTPLNVGSYTGIIMIAGIIGENVIFTYLVFLEARKKMNFRESIGYSVATRLRPKLMTVFTSIITLLPLAIGFGFGTGAQVNQPLAISVIGGLIFALPILLILWPTFQWLFCKEADVITEPENQDLQT